VGCGGVYIGSDYYFELLYITACSSSKQHKTGHSILFDWSTVCMVSWTSCSFS